MDAVKNFAIVTVNQGYDASATSIVLTAGHGAKLPAPATDGEFNLIWYNATDYTNPSDDPNVEIVRCTARSTDTLTVTRAQESTSATVKNTGGKTYKMVLGMTAKMIEDIGVPEVSKEGLVLAMNFNSESIDGSAGSEKVLDSSGHNNHGINHGATHDDDGGFNGGGAFDFDVDSDYIDCGAVADVNFVDEDFSVFAWVKHSGSASLQYIIGNDLNNVTGGWGLLITFDNKISSYLENNQGVSIQSVSVDEWHLVGFSYDHSEQLVTFYLDGKAVGTDSNVAGVSASAHNLIIGIDPRDNTGYEFNGLIDEPRIYNRVLSADEIRNLYMAKKEIHNSFVSQKDIYVDADGKPAIQSDILNIKTAKTPATAGASGVAGDICWDASYIYVCTATNTWKRVAIATW